MKRCSSCGVKQSEEKFKSRSKTGRQAGQRHSMCNRCLYLRYTRPNAQKKVELIAAYKMEQGCTDCGYAEHPMALEFDHQPGLRRGSTSGRRLGRTL